MDRSFGILIKVLQGKEEQMTYTSVLTEQEAVC